MTYSKTEAQKTIAEMLASGRTARVIGNTNALAELVEEMTAEREPDYRRADHVE